MFEVPVTIVEAPVFCFPDLYFIMFFFNRFYGLLVVYAAIVPPKVFSVTVAARLVGMDMVVLFE